MTRPPPFPKRAAAHGRQLALVVAVLAVLPVARLAPVRAAQVPTFSTSLEAVPVDVLVTESGRVVAGLGPEDFEIRDNGVVQQVDLVSFEQLPLNIILAFDASSSIAGERLDHLKSAGQALLERLVPGDQTALLTFNQVVVLREALTPDVERVRAALDGVEPIGDTSMADGVYAAMMVGEADAARDLLIVFSDGVDNSSWLSGDAVLDASRRSDVVVYGVSVRGTEDPEFLRDLTELTGGRLFEVESTRNLSATFVGILEEFRQRYLLSYSPRGVSAEGWHELDVRVRGRRATVKARAGYVTGS
jgi:VWFA-related protein